MTKHWVPLSAFLAFGMLACAEPPAESLAADEAKLEAMKDEHGDEESQPDVYEILGQIATLPDPDDVQKQFSVKHEAIDDFKGIGGEIWGMDSMTMPFDVAEEVSLEGLVVGDIIRFRLAVDWFGDPPQEITSIEKMPGDTELEFRPAKPVDAEAAEGTEDGSEG